MKVCSDTMAATSMDFIKFGVYETDFIQWPQIKWFLSQTFNSRLKFLEKLLPKIEQFPVLFTGFFGLQNSIFGKFCWCLIFANIWKRLNTCTSDGAAGWSL